MGTDLLLAVRQMRGMRVANIVARRLASDAVSIAGYDADMRVVCETSAQITATLKSTAELLCPHSAVGVKVAEDQRVTGTPMITLATAHPAKFPDAVNAATGIHPPLPPRMADLYERAERLTRVPNDLGALMAHIKENRSK